MDQLVIFMALAEGESEIIGREPTLHTRTAVAVAEMLTRAKFTIKVVENGLWSIQCVGTGVRVENSSCNKNY